MTLRQKRDNSDWDLNYDVIDCDTWRQETNCQKVVSKLRDVKMTVSEYKKPVTFPNNLEITKAVQKYFKAPEGN